MDEGGSQVGVGQIGVGQIGGGRGRGARAIALAWPRPAGVRPAVDLGAWVAPLQAAMQREAALFDPVLMLPIMLGTGIALYFAAPEEPGVAGPLAAGTVLAALAWVSRRRWALHCILLALLEVVAGFADARLRTLAVEAPHLARPITAMVTGVVLETDARAGGGQRILIRPTVIEGLAPGQWPARLRLTARRAPALEAGSTITAKALMQPPSAPALPGGYDFARDAFFDQIGGVGFVAGSIGPAPAAALSRRESFHAWLDRRRNDLTTRIVTAIPGVDGAVAASQVTGKRALIPDDANTALRAAGLYHVVSISGLHMGLFAGGLFWLIRAALALVPRIALTWPVKNLAALLALAPAAAYTAFSGAEVATMRSFLMTAVALVAVALGRQAVTRRNVALSAAVVLLATPETLLGPSFQMSFAAVSMLVAWVDRPRRPDAHDWLLGLPKPIRAVLGLTAITVVASLATAPFSTYHFHRITLQAIVSNLVATPLVEMAMMPLALLALLAEPFGYGLPFWWAMGRAVHLFMLVAHAVAAWPGADLVTPQFSAATLLAFVIGLLILAVFHTRIAAIAALPVALGILAMATTDRPGVLVGAGGRAALVREGETLRVVAARRDAFVVGQWLLAMGDRRLPADASLGKDVRCDPQGCAVPLGESHSLLLDRTPDAVEEDCGSAFVLVTPLAVPACGPPTLVIDHRTIDPSGSLALYQDARSPSGWRIVSAREPGLDRPWASRAPEPDAEQAPPQLAPATEGSAADSPETADP